jgi:hypothetical protein
MLKAVLVTVDVQKGSSRQPKILVAFLAAVGDKRNFARAKAFDHANVEVEVVEAELI